MATVRLVEGCGGAAYLEIDTDAQNRIVALRARNVAVVGGRSGGGGQRIGRTFGDAESSLAVPTNPANRIQLTARRGGLDGFDATIELACPLPQTRRT